jgi:hypothetical protein
VVAALAPACGRSPVLLVEHAGAGLLDDGADDDAPAPSCEEVDVLFVIDDSPSMGDNQRKLVENYDVFLDGMTALVESRASVHLGVVATDLYSHNIAGCRELGDLVVNTGGHGSSDMACGPYANGNHFISEADDVDTAFKCAAQVGTAGATFEQSMGAAIHAIGGGDDGPSECNAGFVRDGAMLVIVFVTDEDGELDPELAFEALMEARGWYERGVVVVTLANLPDGDCRLSNHAEIADDLVELTEMFTFGFLAPVCADDYSEVFAQAVGVVADACGG